MRRGREKSRSGRKVEKHLRDLSLFSGIGAFEKALDNLEIPYELVAYCEIDKYASKSYAAIHNVSEEMNLGDITKVDAKKLPKDIDLLTYGFPCQDISLAGKQKGLFNADGTQTRSGLFFEALRIIEETQPKVAIAENVKNLTSKKFALQFKIVLDSLKAAGYNNYWQILNAKDYGVPQNRERVFIISIRKDIDTGTFKFPEGFPLQLRLKDMLEDEVDEKYYINDAKIVKNLLTTSCDKAVVEPKIEVVGNYSPSGHDASRIVSADGIAPTVKENHGTVTATIQGLRIRKLTPKECFRLMGFDDADFEKAEAVNSNTQLYKQAGNSIVVPVLENLIKAIAESGVWRENNE